MLCLLATAGLAPLILALNLPLLVALSALAGLCYAPITTCQLAVIDEVVHPAHKAESFTWLSTLYGAGLALGAVIAGQLITTAGVRLALATATASTLVAWLLSLAFRDTMRNPAPDQQAATTT
jgi:MFS family permease